MEKENAAIKNQKLDSEKMNPKEAEILLQYAAWRLDGQSKELCSVCSDNCHCNAHCN